MDLKIDDLLEKVRDFLLRRVPFADLYVQQKDNKHLLDLEYVQLNVPKTLVLLNKVFAKRKQ
jgi:Ras GTPase-activating-like protein IQGAP2/3